MFLVKTFVVVGLLGGATLASPPTTNEPQRPSRPAAALQQVVRQLVRDGAPGAVVVVRTPAGVTRARAGLARLHPRTAMEATDRFRVASITKTFVAALVLQLDAAGGLSLSDPVERWLPGLVPNGRRITIRELLDHTSGLFDYTDDDAFVRAVIASPGRSWTARRLVAIATSHPPRFAPGRGWWYSNTNYILLGLVVEAATRTPIGVQLERHLFEPLGLAHTSFRASIDRDVAHGYIGFATLPRLRSLLDVTTVVSPSTTWTAGGIVSNGDDVTRFYAALLGGHVLPLRLLREMRTPVPRSHYGLGLLAADTRCGRAYGHEGIGPAYRAVVYARADGSRVALVMINVDETYVSQGELEDLAATAFCST
jgi:D-alanyl-D-alanine carboxypeptidase